ncbi:Uncharacterised protein [Vibrio cholerae]|nr:Uncharacterised protein [Vibrio cholerae]
MHGFFVRHNERADREATLFTLVQQLLKPPPIE